MVLTKQTNVKTHLVLAIVTFGFSNSYIWFWRLYKGRRRPYHAQKKRSSALAKRTVYIFSINILSSSQSRSSCHLPPPRITISRRSGIKPYGHRLAPYRSAQGFEPYSRFAPHQAHNLSRVSCRRRSS